MQFKIIKIGDFVEYIDSKWHEISLDTKELYRQESEMEPLDVKAGV